MVLVNTHPYRVGGPFHDLQSIFQIAAFLRPNRSSALICKQRIVLAGHHHTVSHQC